MKAAIVGLLALLLQAQSTTTENYDYYHDGSFGVSLYEEAGTTTPVITVSREPVAADEVIVITYYHITANIGGKDLPLLWTKTSVIPCVPGAHVASDAVPVTKDKIERVQIRLVKVVAEDSALLMPGAAANVLDTIEGQQTNTSGMEVARQRSRRSHSRCR